MAAQPVVVAVDGSEGAARAASWAVAEAARRGARLELVLVNDDPARSEYARNAVQKAAAGCAGQASQVEVSGAVAEGRPVDELVRHSERAQLMVVGSRGHGGFTDALLGGVSSGVATHACCPVVVVRVEASSVVGPVVVGVDASEASAEALAFAYESASRLGADLVALQAWHEEGLFAVPLPAPDRDRAQRDVERLLERQTAPLRARYPHVRTSAVARHGHPVASLTGAAREARLLVVGHRGRGGFEGLFLGSVAVGVLHHAPCPVAVVRR